MTDDRHSEELGAAIRAAVAGVHAPAGLRARVEADRAARRSPRRRGVPGLGFAGAAAAGLCAAAIVLVMGLLGGEERREGPTLAGAVNVALRAPIGRPPAEDEKDPVLIRAGINGLRFPYWDDVFGLEAVSSRRDHVGGRSAMTVLYTGRGQRIGYTIVAGPALTLPDDARSVRRGRLPLAVFRQDGAAVVTWRRAGHTCVLASRQASSRRLLSLAAWTGGGRVSGYRR